MQVQIGFQGEWFKDIELGSKCLREIADSFKDIPRAKDYKPLISRFEIEKLIIERHADAIKECKTFQIDLEFVKHTNVILHYRIETTMKNENKKGYYMDTYASLITIKE